VSGDLPVYILLAVSVLLIVGAFVLAGRFLGLGALCLPAGLTLILAAGWEFSSEASPYFLGAGAIGGAATGVGVLLRHHRRDMRPV
jgi:hypothetical protein